MRVFRTKPFSRFADREGISDETLCDAARRAGKGLIDADLGGGVIKQRIARPGEGRSGGFRSIVLFRRGDRAVFVHGYAKKDLADIGPSERAAFRKLAAVMLEMDEAALDAAKHNGTIFAIECPEAGNA